MTGQRYGSIIRVKPEMLEEYKTLHAAVWPAVLSRISESGIRNYSIFYKDGWLFSYFEYTGHNFERDMQLMAQEEVTQQWWALCKPCQLPLETRRHDEWWATMEEVFHTD